VLAFRGERLRDESLNGEIFYTPREAKVLIERWRREYNTVRPHSLQFQRSNSRPSVAPYSFLSGRNESRMEDHSPVGAPSLTQ
jgi:hypothetical protein